MKNQPKYNILKIPLKLLKITKWKINQILVSLKPLKITEH